MRLNPAAFNRFLGDIGQTFQWRRADACPCINPNSGAAKPGCPHCGGKGRIWHAPLETVAGVASAKVQREWAMSGMWENGDLVLSVPGNSPMWEMGQFDRVTAMNTSDRFSHILMRGSPVEKLLFKVKSVDRVFWIDPVSQAIVEGKLPAVSDAGMLSWPNGGGPPANTSYTLGGTKFLDYYVFGDMPRNRNEHHGERLPKAAVLRRWDLLGRGNAAGY
jgi:hypothetical protein